ncbi:MAG: sulfite exporter TauE/SafE family protein [Candidatus Pacebacteria bacterium]|nr:sulfite exporter TauE/SafE family protein [Candidatus Paceibacterota bacterium]
MDWMFLFYVVFGFLAQMIDGCLGMAYGVLSNSLLLSLGLPPAISSACTHTAEFFTTLASGVSHWKLGNVDKKLFLRLLIPGVIGGALGAYILTQLPGNRIKPFIAIYLLVMGVIIMFKAFKKANPRELKRSIVPLGFAGGICDAIGGGGWGPVVTSTLVANGQEPKKAIGSVNSSEFFVTVAESVTFFITMGALITQHWLAILGLLLGALPTAPVAAYVCKKMRPKPLMIMVGLLIIATSFRTIYLSWLR